MLHEMLGAGMMGLEDGNDSAPGNALGRLQGGAHLSGMMGIVVHHKGFLGQDLEAALGPFKNRQGSWMASNYPSSMARPAPPRH